MGKANWVLELCFLINAGEFLDDQIQRVRELACAVVLQAAQDIKSNSVMQRVKGVPYQIYKCGKKCREDAKNFLRTDRLEKWAAAWCLDLDSELIQEKLKKYF